VVKRAPSAVADHRCIKTFLSLSIYMLMTCVNLFPCVVAHITMRCFRNTQVVLNESYSRYSRSFLLALPSIPTGKRRQISAFCFSLYALSGRWGEYFQPRLNCNCINILYRLTIFKTSIIAESYHELEVVAMTAILCQ
jgi:hypothetical protein